MPILGLEKFHIGNPRLRICLVTKIYGNTKIFKSQTKKAGFVYFWAANRKLFCHIWNQEPRICVTEKFHEKTETPKFGNKNALFWRFGQQCWKAIVIFEISNLEFSLLQSFVQKLNIIRFGNKSANFGARILKYYCHIWNQRPRICLLTNLEANTKIFKFGTKTALFEYFFSPKMPYLDILVQ